MAVLRFWCTFKGRWSDLKKQKELKAQQDIAELVGTHLKKEKTWRELDVGKEYKKWQIVTTFYTC